MLVTDWPGANRFLPPRRGMPRQFSNTRMPDNNTGNRIVPFTMLPGYMEDEERYETRRVFDQLNRDAKEDRLLELLTQRLAAAPAPAAGPPPPPAAPHGGGHAPAPVVAALSPPAHHAPPPAGPGVGVGGVALGGLGPVVAAGTPAVDVTVEIPDSEPPPPPPPPPPPSEPHRVPASEPASSAPVTPALTMVDQLKALKPRKTWTPDELAALDKGPKKDTEEEKKAPLPFVAELRSKAKLAVPIVDARPVITRPTGIAEPQTAEEKEAQHLSEKATDEVERLPAREQGHWKDTLGLSDLTFVRASDYTTARKCFDAYWSNKSDLVTQANLPKFKKDLAEYARKAFHFNVETGRYAKYIPVKTLRQLEWERAKAERLKKSEKFYSASTTSRHHPHGQTRPCLPVHWSS